MYLDNVHRYKTNQEAATSQAQGQPARDSRVSPLLVDLLAKERVGVQPTSGMMSMKRLEGKGGEQEEVSVHAVGTG